MFKHVFTFLAVILALSTMAPQEASAVITTGSGTASPRSIASDAPATVTINWRMNRAGGPGPYTVEADDGALHLGSANGPTLALTDTLSKTLNPPGAPNNFTVTFTETLRISRTHVQRAAESGEPLVYVREFTDNNFIASTFLEATITITGSMGVNLAIRQIRLNFADGSVACSADQGDALSAEAEILADGTGMLRGAWQVRENDRGSFLTLKNVQLPVSAGNNLVLKSPPLPTDAAGRVDVRFHVTAPDLSFDEPFISCFLSGSGMASPLEQDKRPRAEMVSPRTAIPLNVGSKLQWKTVNGAKSYLVEILPGTGGKPVAAMRIPAGKSETAPSPLVLEKTDPSENYLVRVIVE